MLVLLQYREVWVHEQSHNYTDTHIHCSAFTAAASRGGVTASYSQIRWDTPHPPPGKSRCCSPLPLIPREQTCFHAALCVLPLLCLYFRSFGDILGNAVSLTANKDVCCYDYRYKIRGIIAEMKEICLFRPWIDSFCPQKCGLYKTEWLHVVILLIFMWEIIFKYLWRHTGHLIIPQKFPSRSNLI